MPRVTSLASTVSWIVPGYGMSRAAGIVSIFAVASDHNGGTLLTVTGSNLLPPPRSDFNSDARSDLLWQNGSGEIVIWEMGGGHALDTFAMDFDNPNWMELYLNPGSNSYFFDTGATQDVWFHVAV